MLKKEFDEKYEMESVLEEASKFILWDVVILDGLMMGLVVLILVLTNLVVTILAGIVAVTIGVSYWMWKQKKKNIILDNNFMDLTVFCSDGMVVYQYAVDKHELMREGEWILINNDFILDTTALFAGDYIVHESILSYMDDVDVLTKYGLGKAPCVIIETTYEGEYELEEKTVPVLMIRLTGPVAMELSR